ncbi:MAG: DEAD/DEAH box helicase family protein [Candidatus Methylomirabilales bacterium]
MMSRRKAILDAIAREESKLASLQTEVSRTQERLDRYRSDLAAINFGTRIHDYSSQAPSNGPTAGLPSEKIALFRGLFRGRPDVFPRRWENPKTSKSGYSPACANEWVRGVCEKKKSPGARKGKASCGECVNQAFIPVSNQEIRKHLQGRHVMGAYPLLEDETCWFLAVDFDKKSWMEDTAAFVETCRSHGVPVAVERSRSGNGAHAWFFFNASVPVAIARKMGCYLLTETMARRHQLSMDSYDRLFPNQDTMHKGGFGNLIALPLQYEARRQGNTEFVDQSFKPYPDQWAFLAGVKKMEPARAQQIAYEAMRRGQVIGIRISDSAKGEDGVPWNQPPSGRPLRIQITDCLPKEISVVLGQRLFIEKRGLPSALLNQIKRIAAFQNPEFYKKQSMRLSTALTPRVISCAEELVQHIALPRGCRDEVDALLHEHGVNLSVEDRRADGKALDLHFQGTLTPVQEQAARELLTHDTGVFVAPSGVGKTVVATYMVAARGRSTLILVHRQPLLEQWVAQLAWFLDIEPASVGRIGGGKRRPNGRLDVAMIQSLVRKGQVDDLVAGYGHVIVDECHHIPAVSFERVLSEAKARFLIGLTATPQRRDGHHPITRMQLGPVRFSMDSKGQGTQRPFEHRLIIRETRFRRKEFTSSESIQEIYAALASDERRNDLIFDDVVCALEEGRSPILLTERRDHLDYFAERLRKFTRHMIVLRGGMKAKERREVDAQMASIPDEEERLLLATGRYIGEGFDDSRLDTLFLALPVSWKGTLVQYAGRLHRLHPGKTEVRIYDYVDSEVSMLERMFEKRLRGYRAIGYSIDRKPGLDECAVNEPVIEWDKEALRCLGDEDWG